MGAGWVVLFCQVHLPVARGEEGGAAGHHGGARADRRQCQPQEPLVIPAPCQSGARRRVPWSPFPHPLWLSR